MPFTPLTPRLDHAHRPGPLRTAWRLIACLGGLVIGLASAAERRPDVGVLGPLAKDYSRILRPALKRYCLECHNATKHKGDLDLDRFAVLKDVLKEPKVWEKVVEQLSLGEMPPKDRQQPDAGERERLLGWINTALETAAQATAGDPGPVVLRRLNNAEYTWTIRDLTGVPTLDPVREFPGDSAAGEGFMNTGGSLVMSPALMSKYLDAAKDVASHAVLVPDGFRFSTHTTRRDWTEEILADIRALYRQFTDNAGADRVNLQGIVFDTNEGGRLPVERYLEAALALREEGIKPTAADNAVRAAAKRNGLSLPYFQALWRLLEAGEAQGTGPGASEGPSLILDRLRQHWKTATKASVPALTAEIAQWQKALWKFSSVGHIGKAGGPKAWLEPVNPLVERQEFRVPLNAPPGGGDVKVYLVAGDAGDGARDDSVLWQSPQIVIPGRPNLLLRDARRYIAALADRRDRFLAATARCLAASAQAAEQTNTIDLATLAARHGVEPDALAAWLGYLGIGAGSALKLDHFTNRIDKAGNYDFIKGWGSAETPLLVANASDQAVRIPGNLRAHGVAVHPSPSLNAAVGWLCPEGGRYRVDATVTHAHPECGNGVSWALELRRGGTRQRLAAGDSQGGKPVKAGPIEDIAVQPGDLVSLLVGPRDGNHSCDLTEVELALQQTSGERREWLLSREVSADVQAGNPHADGFGHPAVWHFYTEPVSGRDSGPVIPAGSILARWQSSGDASERTQLAEALQGLLSGATGPADGPDAALRAQLRSLGGPLFTGLNMSAMPAGAPPVPRPESAWGLDPAQFGHAPDGSSVEPADVCVTAPTVLEIILPSDWVAGAEFVVTGTLKPGTGGEGSVQLQVSTTPPGDPNTLRAGESKVAASSGPWTSFNPQVAFSSPMIVKPGSAAQLRIEASFDAFRRWFPAALCYVKIVPVDEVVTLTLFHREDEHLSRLMLDEAQRARLNRLWDELHFVSQDALTLVDAFEQLWQYATQDADPKVFEPMRKPIAERAAAFRRDLESAQPRQLDALVRFAASAWRRPLNKAESDELRSFYRKLRGEELAHEDAFRLTLARVFVSPAFLYRAEESPAGRKPARVSDVELAARLSYFLWSSAPDAALSEAAATRALTRDADAPVREARRMLKDPRVRRLATEFACAWLHIHDFESLDEKSEKHFPTFAGLRGAMYEEAILFFTDLFQNDGSVLSVVDADHTFLNEELARHYGITGVTGKEWRRVDGVRAHGRGGVLGLGATLSKESGASRTSPILRGNWVAEVLLGDKLPKPPKGVPRLPEDEAAETLTVRQLVEKHSTDPACAVCHVRIDPFGYALEGFDAIGRFRTQDLGGRPVDSRVVLFDGTPVEGAAGLRGYLAGKKRDAFERQFCRKLLGYALGRGVILSDMPLLSEMQRQLREHDHRFSAAVETIVRSRQFREIRGRDFAEAR